MAHWGSLSSTTVIPVTIWMKMHMNNRRRKWYPHSKSIATDAIKCQRNVGGTKTVRGWGREEGLRPGWVGALVRIEACRTSRHNVRWSRYSRSPDWIPKRYYETCYCHQVTGAGTNGEASTNNLRWRALIRRMALKYHGGRMEPITNTWMVWNASTLPRLNTLTNKYPNHTISAAWSPFSRSWGALEFTKWSISSCGGIICLVETV